MAKAGRPSLYSDALAERICSQLAGGKSMMEICRQAGMPDRVTVIRWTEKYPAFATQCARAREHQADYLQDEMATLEKDVVKGKLDPQAAKVVLSSKQWRASKLAPKTYGDKQQVDVNASVSILDLVTKSYEAPAVKPASEGEDNG